MVAIAREGVSSGLPLGEELVAFTDAAAGTEDLGLARARERLVHAAGEAFMVDAAAVVANFEMMTRVADGTGARFPTHSEEQRRGLATPLGIDSFTSARR